MSEFYNTGVEWWVHKICQGRRTDDCSQHNFCEQLLREWDEFRLKNDGLEKPIASDVKD